MTLVARQYYVCYDNLGQPYTCRSAWYDWGRWVALAVIIVAAFLLFFLCSCFSARRRRRAGRAPYYGTGWTGRTPFGHGAAQYNPNYSTQPYQPPPAYNQPSNAGYYGQPQGENAGYFGGTRDVELQPPQHSYRGGDNVYQPPQGPPPPKR